ncbi:amino acid adenylation domain-containing protein [Nocardia puris]|uniref:Non-ribosomal peptide synthetase-like protein n=1 Tax=Nocardia puris TaxID=208602 RepID=A0A366DBD7_9NOCA|nr:Pls/PosA family non-ribosomal peptide synthetase [Nocardia puris]MBF6214617.1 amino acid adenylation domain-containing protein [Nocardia puris]MBF6366026.1 amino acid adenylation domain-containing protein [Nocardia puris]MBF6460331.1 amino acid adenylation domain-containing protein [Nocardia puris]RBO87326.1 non-ribosomal peptide synthetase-like protein [Nocardia puris]
MLQPQIDASAGDEPVERASGSPLLRGLDAPPPRTLIDIVAATAATHPDADALDDGAATLTYAELLDAVRARAAELHAAGVRPGDRVGVRMPSGDRALYVTILAVLWAGAAYVPVDADDPEERARLVFGEARVRAIATADGIEIADVAPAGTADDARELTVEDEALMGTSQQSSGSTAAHPPAPGPTTHPTLTDDAWIIFTSGSTGTPKGVAVTHRSAAAFVDAEARLFLQDAPIAPGDRVLAGLSVAFDASCEEMWLAWRNGACLVPAPRALVRTGADLGPWLVRRGITVVSTVPTLAATWPVEALEPVRLLIFGGEAVPPELAERLADKDNSSREVWNTYGPTEATVVACAARLTGEPPVRIGLPLDGWDLAVVDAEGKPVPEGETGELVIGGVGLARYLDPAKDAEKYAPMPTLGWERAYRSGDLVRNESAGLIFLGRADDQIKLGGRRIELGEIDNALQHLPGVTGAAAAIRTTKAGNKILVGYLTGPDTDYDIHAARELLAGQLPAPLVPRLAVVDELPTRTSGKVDRAALPWPLPKQAPATDDDGLTATERWVATQWDAILGAEVTGPETDFFDVGGGSLAAAQLVTALRERYPRITVADLYDHPRLGALAALLDASAPVAEVEERDVRPTPLSAQITQVLATVPLTTLTGLQWLTWLAIVGNIAAWSGSLPWLPRLSWWWALIAFVLFISPPGRMALCVAGARILLRGVKPGSYPRGGQVHLRLWAAVRLSEASGAENLSGAPWMVPFARALGAKIGKGVDLHTLPPVTGMLELGDGCSVEPEVDLSGYWIDGDLVHIGPITVGPGAVVGARSILLPGTKIGKNAEIAPGSAVSGRVKPEQQWAGSPAVKVGRAQHPWPPETPARARHWVVIFGVTSMILAALPVAGIGAGGAFLAWWVRDTTTLADGLARAFLMLPVAVLLSLGVYAAATIVLVRLFAIGLTEGYHPVRSRVGWQAWSTERLLDSARTFLFPLYASLLTPVWLRLLGAKVGKHVEASTVLLLPKFTTVADGAFLADDTMIASYELGGGWLRIGEAKVGKRAFLGNSGMTAPGRRVPKNGLVAVLSAAPTKAKAGSSWLGSPPVRLRRASESADARRTYDPPKRLRVARAFVETCRLFPVLVTFAIGLGVLFALAWLAQRIGHLPTALLSGVVLLAAGAVACGSAVLAKWLLVGRIRAEEHPLWSSFVWRNEVSDTFVETVAAPWFARAATGTPVLNLWLRALGADIGRGVWCESYWLPEADLVTLGDGATVERGCVVQTHLFHDRIMAMDTVVLGAGATLGPHCVALPAASIGAGATVGPASLVMRGDTVPPSTRWWGNPIAPWTRETGR